MKSRGLSMLETSSRGSLFADCMLSETEYKLLSSVDACLTAQLGSMPDCWRAWICHEDRNGCVQLPSLRTSKLQGVCTTPKYRKVRGLGFRFDCAHPPISGRCTCVHRTVPNCEYCTVPNDQLWFSPGLQHVCCGLCNAACCGYVMLHAVGYIIFFLFFSFSPG